MEPPEDYLRRMLDASGLSARQAVERAEHAGFRLSFPYLMSCLQGRVTDPAISSVEAIAAAIDRPIEEVFAVFRGKDPWKMTGRERGCLSGREALKKYKAERAKNPDALVILEEHCGGHWGVKVYATDAEKNQYVRQALVNMMGKVEETVLGKMYERNASRGRKR